MPGLGMEPGTHWGEASTLTTLPSLLPQVLSRASFIKIIK